MGFLLFFEIKCVYVHLKNCKFRVWRIVFEIGFVSVSKERMKRKGKKPPFLFCLLCSFLSFLLVGLGFLLQSKGNIFLKRK